MVSRIKDNDRNKRASNNKKTTSVVMPSVN